MIIPKTNPLVFEQKLTHTHMQPMVVSVLSPYVTSLFARWSPISILLACGTIARPYLSSFLTFKRGSAIGFPVEYELAWPTKMDYRKVGSGIGPRDPLLHCWEDGSQIHKYH